jgi:Ca2+-binding RTX toxin-like protein
MPTIISTPTSSQVFLNNPSTKADRFTITASGSIIASSPSFTSGAAGLSGGPWIVRIDGSIENLIGPGLFLQSTGTSQITLGKSGHINADIPIIVEAVVSFSNAGHIEGASGVEFGHAATVINSGSIDTPTPLGALYFNGDGLHKIINTGSITGATAIGSAGNTIEHVTNKHIINGLVTLGDGNDSFASSGLVQGSVDMGAGNDSVTNFIKSGKHIRSGKVTGIIDLGAGNDHFNGGTKAEIVQDWAGSDTYKLGGGNDIYRAANAPSDGADRIDGGGGRDTYDANAAGGPLKINLDSVKHNLLPISNTPEGIVAAHTATGAPVAGAFKDTIKGFENAVGGGDSDLIYGSAAANKLEGGEGGDNLLGFGGNDELHGDQDSDGIAGGAGRDVLFGGGGGDFFQFFSVRDSGIKAKSRDVIMDWDGSDHIVFYFDGNTKKAGHQGFTFLASDGAAFTHHAGPNGEGEVRFFHTATQTIVQADVNHDGKADFSVAINATTGLSVTDFQFL